MTVSFFPHRATPSAWLGCFLALLAGARADQVTIFPSADATLFELVPTNSLGGVTWISAGTTQNGNTNRALLKFDIAAAVPAGSTIIDIGVNVWVTRSPVDGNADSLFSLRRVLRPWNEGANQPADPNYPGLGAPAQPGDATWTHAAWGADAWTIPGGLEGVDFAGGFSSSTFIAGVSGDPYFFESGGMVADVQLWLDQPAQNFGWLLKTEEEDLNFTARRFGSRELEDPFESPQLIITYLPPLLITNVLVVSNRLSLTFHAELGYPHRVESRATAGGTNAWTTLTNFGLILSPGPRTATDALTNAARFYRVRRN
jgi:hypothetical protein